MPARSLGAEKAVCALGGEQPSLMAGEMKLEVWFPDQQPAVSLASSLDGTDDARFHEVCLFALFAARQITNLGRGDVDGLSLAQQLMAVDVHEPLSSLEVALSGDITSWMMGRGVAPEFASKAMRFDRRSNRRSAKGFAAFYRPQAKAFFRLDTHGFGILSGGVGYYAPASVFAALAFLLGRRAEDVVYQQGLVLSAQYVGDLGASDGLRLVSNSTVAMEAALAAWTNALAAEEPVSAEDLLLASELDLSSVFLDGAQGAGDFIAGGPIFQDKMSDILSAGDDVDALVDFESEEEAILYHLTADTFHRDFALTSARFDELLSDYPMKDDVLAAATLMERLLEIEDRAQAFGFNVLAQFGYIWRDAEQTTGGNAALLADAVRVTLVESQAPPEEPRGREEILFFGAARCVFTGLPIWEGCAGDYRLKDQFYEAALSRAVAACRQLDLSLPAGMEETAFRFGACLFDIERQLESLEQQ
jgi:hypothetical protein